MELLDLKRRLEAGVGIDRKLDLAIYNIAVPDSAKVTFVWTEQQIERGVPRYTSDMNAAMDFATIAFPTRQWSISKEGRLFSSRLGDGAATASTAPRALVAAVVAHADATAAPAKPTPEMLAPEIASALSAP